MTENLRLFFAVQLEPELETALAQLIAKLKKESWGHRIRWVKPEKLHLTLRFIGGTKAEEVPILIQQCKEIVKTIRVFTLQLNKVHIFPSADKPYVIAFNIRPHQILSELVQKLEEGIVAAGFKAEKRAFLPHITLGRVIHRPISIAVENHVIDNINFQVSNFTLINSQKTEHGQIYKPIQQFTLPTI